MSPFCHPDLVIGGPEVNFVRVRCPALAHPLEPSLQLRWDVDQDVQVLAEPGIPSALPRPDIGWREALPPRELSDPVPVLVPACLPFQWGEGIDMPGLEGEEHVAAEPERLSVSPAPIKLLDGPQRYAFAWPPGTTIQLPPCARL